MRTTTCSGCRLSLIHIYLDAVMEKFSNNLEHFYTESQMKQLAELLQSFEKMDGAQPLLKALEIEKAGI